MVREVKAQLCRLWAVLGRLFPFSKTENSIWRDCKKDAKTLTTSRRKSSSSSMSVGPSTGGGTFPASPDISASAAISGSMGRGGGGVKRGRPRKNSLVSNQFAADCVTTRGDEEFLDDLASPDTMFMSKWWGISIYTILSLFLFSTSQGLVTYHFSLF